MCAKDLRSLPLAVIQEKPTFGTMEAHLWQFCQSDREKPTFEASKPEKALFGFSPFLMEAHLWQIRQNRTAKDGSPPLAESFEDLLYLSFLEVIFLIELTVIKPF